MALEVTDSVQSVIYEDTITASSHPDHDPLSSTLFLKIIECILFLISLDFVLPFFLILLILLLFHHRTFVYVISNCNRHDFA